MFVCDCRDPVWQARHPGCLLLLMLQISRSGRAPTKSILLSHAHVGDACYSWIFDFYVLISVLLLLCLDSRAAKNNCGWLDSSKAVIVSGYLVAQAHWFGREKHACWAACGLALLTCLFYLWWCNVQTSCHNWVCVTVGHALCSQHDLWALHITWVVSALDRVVRLFQSKRAASNGLC